MMRIVVLLSILTLSLAWSEPSVYGASGSYISPQKNRAKIESLKREIEQLKQEIEGLKSVVDGLGASINEEQSKLDSKTNSTQTLQKLASMIDEINANYVSKKELKMALAGKGVSISKKSTKKSTPKTDKLNATLNRASSSALYSKGVRLIRQGKYTQAKLRFDILKRRKYKKAPTYFYLGEIAYRAHKYQDAIDYYKVSAQSDEGANYMDKLLLHTALSLEKIGQKSQAKRFFQAILDGYPDSASAKIAKKHL